MRRHNLNRYLALVFLISCSCLTKGLGNEEFDFETTLRFDFILAGDHSNQRAYPVSFSQHPGWSGTVNQLISPFDFGEYRYLLIHPESGDTLFQRGFSTLFEEWRTVEEAKYSRRAFQQTVLMPMPLMKMTLVIDGRERDGLFLQLLKETIEPGSLSIKISQPTEFEKRILHGDLGVPKADFLIMAEGFEIDEMEVFFQKAVELTEAILNVEPFKSHRDLMSVSALGVPSKQSGVNDPHQNTWRNSAMGVSFNSLGIDRYLVTESFWKVHDYAAQVPHDHLIILVNGNKYGGGGIYNHFSVVTSHNRLSAEVLLHEIGHGFAGLGDEYFDSDVSYTDYINQEIEPWQPNLTTLINFGSKWEYLLSSDTPVPTPIRPKYRNVTGVFEGGGYVAKGVFRPAINCRMRSVDASAFCEVCHKVILQKLLFYSQ
ncbi:M64 family metallopeptidase [Alkalitalea saponilacus]|uniref:Peptidase M64 N-terminus n=1 Tax=Alkalitalea saponilacus TaxID=889453 RepID=A0A1T5HH10_9BACT|nr:M64 family metallopeptidase [Alkalitalea saponilacus]ASB48130.1 peptidase M64 [Alkalitalea saponilacus]SKC19954.1 Peptidase M64 N-terminus [Alkalitalea saponilacus]